MEVADGSPARRAMEGEVESLEEEGHRRWLVEKVDEDGRVESSLEKGEERLTGEEEGWEGPKHRGGEGDDSGRMASAPCQPNKIGAIAKEGVCGKIGHLSSIHRPPSQFLTHSFLLIHSFIHSSSSLPNTFLPLPSPSPVFLRRRQIVVVDTDDDDKWRLSSSSSCRGSDGGGALRRIDDGDGNG
ncbi:hypothetical protein niasHT_018247 [Heterodera trifolii]|uniref:Uncharacterized protein n=1 Tax=Heterodera trifolii TaxID=157864 RepID=A0ABD2L5B8_9BILA